MNDLPSARPARDTAASADEAVVDVRHLTKRYGTFTAVEDVTFTLSRGTIHGFLGPNGAGKTTTLRMILDIIRPTSGSLRVLGHTSALAVRNHIGYLPEEKGLYKKMKAWSVVAYFATLKGLSRRAARARAFELLERYGLKDFAHTTTEALSKGMSQKVQVLAAIAHDPELVILDEPFSGLDPVNQQVMEEIIRGMAARGRTILFSTHVMQHAERLCDRILLIARGRKLFEGTVEDARRTLPRRVALETEDDLSGIAGLDGVVSVSRAEPVETSSPLETGRWEVVIREDFEARQLLEACFTRGVRLKGFHEARPSLHDVFVHLVGPGAGEAQYR